MARKVKNERNIDFNAKVFELLMQDAFDKVNKERFAKYFGSLSDEVRAYLLGIAMYEPIIGESVIFGSDKCEGVVTALDYKNLTATVKYEDVRSRYFKTAEEAVKYMQSGEYDYYSSSFSKSDDCAYLGVHTFDGYTDRSWTEIEPNHYSD